LAHPRLHSSLAILENRVCETESKMRTFAADLRKIWQHLTNDQGSPLLQGENPADLTLSSGEQQEVGEDEAVDAMGSVIFANEEEVGYFGPSTCLFPQTIV